LPACLIFSRSATPCYDFERFSENLKLVPRFRLQIGRRVDLIVLRWRHVENVIVAARELIPFGSLLVLRSEAFLRLDSALCGPLFSLNATEVPIVPPIV
jgi:hypothetical protein